jgi:ribosomal protein L10
MAERVVTLEDVKLISKLFSRQAVYQQVASTLNAPMGKLATSLHQIIAKVAYVLKAVSDKKK